jgi:hypothetical protein
MIREWSGRKDSTRWVPIAGSSSQRACTGHWSHDFAGPLCKSEEQPPLSQHL